MENLCALFTLISFFLSFSLSANEAWVDISCSREEEGRERHWRRRWPLQGAVWPDGTLHLQYIAPIYLVTRWRRRWPLLGRVRWSNGSGVTRCGAFLLQGAKIWPHCRERREVEKPSLYGPHKSFNLRSARLLPRVCGIDDFGHKREGGQKMTRLGTGGWESRQFFSHLTSNVGRPHFIGCLNFKLEQGSLDWPACCIITNQL